MKTKILTICSVVLMIGFNLHYATIGYGYNSSKFLKIAHAGIPPGGSSDSISVSDSISDSNSDIFIEITSDNNFTSSDECCDVFNISLCSKYKHVIPEMAVCITSNEWILFNCDSTYIKTIVSKKIPDEALNACYYYQYPHTEEIYDNIVECFPGGNCNNCEEKSSVCPPWE